MKLQKNNRIRARAAKTRFSRAAFTLMEVLLAIAMISMLAFIVVVNLDKTMSESQTKITESFVNGSLQTPLMTFKLAVGRYPTTEEGLKALLEAPEAVSDRWKGPYVRNLPADPWGNPYQYRCPAVKSKDGYDVRMRRARGAFTLAEIILAIALAAVVATLAGTLVFPDSSALEDRPADSILKTAVLRARAESAKIGEQTVLRFQPRGYFSVCDFKTRKEIARLYLRKADERADKSDSENSSGDDAESNVRISFFTRNPEIIDNPGVEFPDGEVREVRFSPDGAMTPFCAVITFSDYVKTVFFDPFSGDETYPDKKEKDD